MTARFVVGDTFEVVRSLPDASVDLVLTSPPFLNLRSYLPADHPDKHREIGSEPSPAEFLDTLLELTVEWRRVLAPHGSICVELGDSYSGSGWSGGDYLAGGSREGQPTVKSRSRASDPEWPLPKSLCGIPTLYAWSLAYGRNLLNPEHEVEPWRVRNVVAWCRPNPPVGALADKVRPATSYLTIACTGRNRYFDLDAVRTPLSEPGAIKHKAKDHSAANPRTGWKFDAAEIHQNPAGAPPLDHWWHDDVFVQDAWLISTQPYKGAHYATWPEALCELPIKAMCPPRVCRTCGKPSERIVGDVTYERTDSKRVPTRLAMNDGARVAEHVNQHVQSNGANTSVIRNASTVGWSDCGHDDWRPGLVLDPFAGSGTTLAVAVGHGRDAIGIDLDGRNAELARERVGMFLTVETPETERSA